MPLLFTMPSVLSAYSVVGEREQGSFPPPAICVGDARI
jgi:hypothetical protein